MTQKDGSYKAPAFKPRAPSAPKASKVQPFQKERTTGAGAGSPECPGGRAQAGSVKCDAAGVVRFAVVAPSRDTAGVASFPSASSFGEAGWRQAALPAQPAAPGVD